MRPLAASEIVGLARYAEIRPAYRARVIAYKRSRRLAVGDRVSLVFEDRETLRFQVQEMLYVERIAEPERVQHELDRRNVLCDWRPGVGVRFGPHFYNTMDDVERGLAEMKDIVRGLAP